MWKVPIALELKDAIADILSRLAGHDAEIEALKSRVSELESQIGVPSTAPPSSPDTEPETVPDFEPADEQESAGPTIEQLETENAAELPETDAPSIVPELEAEGSPADDIETPAPADTPIGDKIPAEQAGA